MSWALLDDQLHGHVKVRMLQELPFAGAEAFGIWAWCLSWCRAYSPDRGRVRVREVALNWHADPEHIAEVFALLVEVGLLDVDGDDFAIHDWVDWQRSPQVKGGVERARTATRVDGRFAPADQRAGELVNAGSPHGHQRATPLHASPLHASPAGDGLATARAIAATLPFSPAPKPTRKRTQ